MGKECGMHGSEGNLGQLVTGKQEKKGSFTRPVLMWGDNIEMDFKDLYEDGF
jgi:hypothetical protein